jgi:Tol biopolymer transport system component
VVNTDGTGLSRISPIDRAQDSGSWSPDGRMILFPNANGKLFVVRPDGSGKRQISIHTTGWAGVSEAVWSPDGTRIAAHVSLEGHGSGLFTLAAGGTDLRAVAGTNGDDEAVDWGVSAG